MTNRIEGNWIDDMVGVFTDPIITYPSPWNETLPDWIGPAITMERLLQNMRAIRGEEVMASDVEAMAYIYPAALEAPLDHDWTQIYLYVAGQAMKRRGTEIPEDIRVESLDRYQLEKLNELKRWLYQARIKARGERRRAERRKAREEAAARAPKQLALPV